MTNPVSRHTLHGSGGRVLDDDHQPRRRRGQPDPTWTLEPRNWRQQPGAMIDQGVDLFAGACDDCGGNNDGVRVVTEHDPVVTVYLLCTKCLVADHPGSLIRWSYRAWQARDAARAAEAHEQRVHAMVFGRVDA